MVMSFSEEVWLVENMVKEFGLWDGNKVIDVKVLVNRDELLILKLMFDVEGVFDMYNLNFFGLFMVCLVYVLF